MTKTILIIFSIILLFNLGLYMHQSKKRKDENMSKTGDTITLPKPEFDSKTSLEEALKNRRSVRSFKDKPLKIEHISQLLWAAYGITKRVPEGPDYLRGGFRSAPSAGALYPLEIYLQVSNVSGLKAGIYKYNSKEHTLSIHVAGDKSEQLGEAALNQPHVTQAPANIVYTAVFERTTQKYGERGKKRYIPMEIGHSSENVYLQAESLEIGTCAVGAFNDQKVKKVIQTENQEVPLYIMPLGYPK